MPHVAQPALCDKVLVLAPARFVTTHDESASKEFIHVNVPAKLPDSAFQFHLFS
jgi:hypothetical protein